MNRVALELDVAAGAGYIRLSEAAVRRTVQVDEDVLLDLDEMNVAVGVEVLRLSAQIPFSRLVDDFHVRTEVVALLRKIQPSISGYLALTQGSEGSTRSVVSAAVPAA